MPATGLTNVKKTASVVLLLLGLSCLWWAGSRHEPLLEMRADYRLDSAEPLENAPPLVAFTTVILGGFRGLMADILWLRVSFLQDEGRYFEVVQLSDWITKLEPRCTETWTYHAWNMAYNVSIMMPLPEDRWRWVKNGIQLLRDRGVLYNSGDPAIYCELGWIYQHKIGGTTDRLNMYYKRRLIEEMAKLFDGPRPDYEKIERGSATRSRVWKAGKLIPGIMREIDSKYGPLDWRLPETHALYWAYRARQYATNGSRLRCDRMIFQCMAAAFRQGRLVRSKDGSHFTTRPRTDLLPKVMEAYEVALAKNPGTHVGEAYANFLCEAAFILYGVGQKKESLEIFNLLRQRFPSGKTAVDFEAFVSRCPRKTSEASRPSVGTP